MNFWFQLGWALASVLLLGRIWLDFAESVYACKNEKSDGLGLDFSIYVATFYLVSLVSVENSCC